MPKKYILKILTAGEGGVGKTTLLHRYIKGEFSADLKMTVGIEFFAKEIIIDDVHVTLQLWDFAGQKHFRFMLDSYVLGAKGALLMFDLTRPITLMNLESWINIVRKDDPNLPILFIGTKLDLKDQIEVEDEYALQFKEVLNLFDYLKVSSKSGENVLKAFELLIKK